MIKCSVGSSLFLWPNGRGLTPLRSQTQTQTIFRASLPRQLSANSLTIFRSFLAFSFMTWNYLSQQHVSIDIHGHQVAILDESCSERYLGRKLAFSLLQEVEIADKIASGWAACTKHKSELCCKHYCLRDRIKLFNATVTPAVLYASSTWALTKKMESKPQVTWRRMLRHKKNAPTHLQNFST